MPNIPDDGITPESENSPNPPANKRKKGKISVVFFIIVVLGFACAIIGYIYSGPKIRIGIFVVGIALVVAISAFYYFTEGRVQQTNRNISNNVERERLNTRIATDTRERPRIHTTETGREFEMDVLISNSNRLIRSNQQLLRSNQRLLRNSVPSQPSSFSERNFDPIPGLPVATAPPYEEHIRTINETSEGIPPPPSYDSVVTIATTSMERETLNEVVLNDDPPQYEVAVKMYNLTKF